MSNKNERNLPDMLSIDHNEKDNERHVHFTRMHCEHQEQTTLRALTAKKEAQSPNDE